MWLRVLLLPSRWDASSQQGYPLALSSQVPIYAPGLVGERHWESESGPRIWHNGYKAPRLPSNWFHTFVKIVVSSENCVDHFYWWLVFAIRSQPSTTSISERIWKMRSLWEDRWSSRMWAKSLTLLLIMYWRKTSSSLARRLRYKITCHGGDIDKHKVSFWEWNFDFQFHH